MSIVKIEGLWAYFKTVPALREISGSIENNTVTAIIGPSGCGKSTFIRCLNRLHEEADGASYKGRVLFNGQNIFDKNLDPVKLRSKIGMVFQKPNPFPGFSIYDNVAVGLRLAGIKDVGDIRDQVEASLRSAALWDEVKDKLKQPATNLSGGQQQRLCIARALAVNPTLLLMDEPTSALDPISTAKIEDLIQELKQKVTVIIVTHNMQQAARVSDFTAFFLSGELIEWDSTSKIFTSPANAQTERYVTGRFG